MIGTSKTKKHCVPHLNGVILTSKSLGPWSCATCNYQSSSTTNQTNRAFETTVPCEPPHHHSFAVATPTKQETNPTILKKVDFKNGMPSAHCYEKYLYFSTVHLQT